MYKNPSLLLTLKEHYLHGKLTWNEYVRLRREALKHGVYAEKEMVDKDLKEAWSNEKIIKFAFGENV